MVSNHLTSLKSHLWYCNAENLEHLWRVMFDMRSEINKLCTNLYQTPISTNGAKIILKKHGPKQQDSCMQMKKTKPVNLKLWTIRIRFHICKLIMIYRAVENLRHNHQPIDTNTRAANSDLENKMLDCATPWCALYIWCHVKSFDWYPESLRWYCNAENLEHLWRVMFDMRSKINKLRTNLYQKPISTYGTK